jgi:hypothetical protein
MLDGLRAAGGEQHVPQPHRGDLDNQPRRFASDVRGMAGGQRAQPVCLFLDSRDDAWVLVTEVGEDQLGAEVQETSAVDVDDMATRAADEGRDGARPLHGPGVEDQLIEIHVALSRVSSGITRPQCPAQPGGRQVQNVNPPVDRRAVGRW